MLWMWRVHSQAAAASGARWYLVAKPATSVWYSATAGMRSCRAAKAPAAPRTKGLARWMMSGLNARRASVTVALGTPIGSESMSGMRTVGTRTISKPRYSWISSWKSRAPGATTIASCPSRWRCSSTLSTEFVTPLTLGRKDSATMATRMGDMISYLGNIGLSVSSIPG